jgi:tetratricopeptide (TPR) repeat protein
MEKLAQKYRLSICFGLALSCLVTSCYLLNRAFIIGNVAAILFLLVSFKKIHFSKKTISLALMFLAGLIGVLTIFLKSDSSLGRLLIYKISFAMFNENPITGIGWGEFGHKYGLYQAQYFRSDHFSVKEFLLADNTYYAFNDYWQFIVENGVVGGFSMLVVIFLLVKATIYKLRNNDKDDLLKLLIAFTIVLCVAAMFTHVFEKRIFQIIVFLAVCYCLLPSKMLVRKRGLKVIFLLLLLSIFSFWQYRFEIRNFNKLQKIETAKTLFAAGYVSEANNTFNELYPSLKEDLSFLSDYNGVLVGSGRLAKKISIIKELNRQYTSSRLYLELAQLYQELGLYKNAEVNYLLAVYMVPNRFVPRKALFDFYSGSGQLSRANFWKAQLLAMPIKIPSAQIDHIRNSLKYEN